MGSVDERLSDSLANGLDDTAREEEAGSPDLYALLEKTFKPFEDPGQDLHQTMKVICMVSSLGFLAASFVLNLAIILNIFCTGKTSVAYFRLLLFYCFFHILFQVTVGYIDCKDLLAEWLEPSEALTWMDKHLATISRSILGVIFLLVATLTVERFLASAVGGVVSICLQLISALIALSCPALLAAFQILSTQRPSSTFSLDSEVWFGLEVGVYIILPLFVLTIFGTINYCKISISSRLMPRYEITGVKVNIGLVVLTNISIFIFLIQECLILWVNQLTGKADNDDAVKSMLEMVSVSLLCVRQEHARDGECLPVVREAGPEPDPVPDPPLYPLHLLPLLQQMLLPFHKPA